VGLMSLYSQLTSSHEGPVWQVAWAHPKFGTILASASYDARVIIWRDSSTSPQQSAWTKLFEHTLHTASVNSIGWAPHDFGALLACASSDGKVSILEFKDDGTWDTKVFNAHGMGCNAASWASASTPGSLVSSGSQTTGNFPKLATGGCDNLVKIWVYEYVHVDG
jgi:protein transport protein SEC13